MDRNKKKIVIDKLCDLYSSNENVFYINISGVTVANITKLRNELRSSSICSVSKNSITKIAAEKAGFSIVNDHLSGQLMTIFSNDPVTPAKILEKMKDACGFSIENYANKDEVHTEDYVAKLSKLPTLDELRAKIVGMISSVPTSIVKCINEVPTSIARLLSQKK